MLVFVITYINRTKIKILFNSCFIIDWETISSSLSNIGINNAGIATRKFTYEFYYKSLCNLKNKGLELVALIEYLNGLKIINYNKCTYCGSIDTFLITKKVAQLAYKNPGKLDENLLIEDFLKEYDVEREVVSADIDEFVEKLKTIGAICE